MKKRFIVLAAFAAATAAQAQSNVQLYGRIDLSLGGEKLNGVSTRQMFNGSDAGLTGSRWGLQGTEDLGSGLKAIFKLENRFNADVGTTSSTFWGGDLFLGLSGGFGTVKLGRTYTMMDDIRALSVSSNVFDSAFTPVSKVWGSGGDFASRGANQVRYESPNFSGLTFGVSHAMDEKTAGQTEVTALNVRYRTGPLDVGYAYQTQEAFNSNAEHKYNVIAAAYNFGPARLSAGINTRKGPADKDDEYSFGINVPLDAFNFSIGYAGSKTKAAGVTIAKASGWGAGVTYALSKRTRAYVGLRDYHIKNAAGVKTTDSRLYAVGVRHDF